jgi:hypothetical protein
MSKALQPATGTKLQTRQGWGLTAWVNAVRGPQVSDRFLGRWSLYRPVRPMNYADFASITQAFHAITSEAFGTPCDIQIRSYKSAPMITSFYDDTLNEQLHNANAPLVLANIPSLLDYFGTPDQPRRIAGPSGAAQAGTAVDRAKPPMEQLWDASGYIQVVISPLDKENAPPHAFGSLVFKGAAPRFASFYVQPYTFLGNQPVAEKVCVEMQKWAQDWLFTENSPEHANNISSELAGSWHRTGVRPW